MLTCSVMNFSKNTAFKRNDKKNQNHCASFTQLFQQIWSQCLVWVRHSARCTDRTEQNTSKIVIIITLVIIINYDNLINEIISQDYRKRYGDPSREILQLANQGLGLFKKWGPGAEEMAQQSGVKRCCHVAPAPTQTNEVFHAHL